MAVVVKREKVNPITKKEYYSDFFVNIDQHPNSGDIAKHVNEESVKTSIKNIILTRKGERFYNSDLGSDIYSLLFENVSPQTEDTMRTLIENAIENYEPRANIVDIIITPILANDESAYGITIYFTTINNQEPISVEVLLNRIR
jgi:phage baseplate assembly protein W